MKLFKHRSSQTLVIFTAMNSISARDRAAIWHPFTQEHTAADNIAVARASGAVLYTADGREIIDAVSSWWVNIHGHANAHIAAAIAAQATQLEQVIFAGFTHEPAVRCAERLLAMLGDPFQKVFYSDDGSTSVEVALKMALQFWHNKGTPRRTIVALEGAYHGDTFGAMAVGARGVFNRPFEPLLFDTLTVSVPVAGNEEQTLQALEQLFKNNEVAAFIFEPLVQGAAGMVMYSPDALDRMLQLCRKHNVLAIADEVMTGFGRTGTLFAFQQLQNEKPDIICLSKGITGGFLPLGVTACTGKLYEAFLSDDKHKALFHGHSYTANPLACAAANACFDLFEKPGTMQQISAIAARNEQLKKLPEQFRNIREVRCMGTIAAVEFGEQEKSTYFNELNDFNERRDAAYAFFLERNVLLRPLGNVVYLIPPYCITETQHQQVIDVITEFAALYSTKK